jgi:hypothetical protein
MLLFSIISLLLNLFVIEIDGIISFLLGIIGIDVIASTNVFFLLNIFLLIKVL